MTSAKLLPVLLLVISNVFMTFAWYGHLKQAFTWSQATGFAFIALGALFVFRR